jgi:hypothetical protein
LLLSVFFVSDYAQSSNELWEMYPVWNKDTCVKLTRQTKLEAVECSTNLPVICTSDLEEINQPSGISKSSS